VTRVLVELKVGVEDVCDGAIKVVSVLLVDDRNQLEDDDESDENLTLRSLLSLNGELGDSSGVGGGRGLGVGKGTI